MQDPRASVHATTYLEGSTFNAPVTIGGENRQPFPQDLNYLPFLDLQTQVFGRDYDMAALDLRLKATDQVAVVRAVGGMGKTTLAKAYLSRFHDNYNHVCWLGSADNLVFSVATDALLHERLRLRFANDAKPAERFLAVMHTLNALPGKNLLVLDNAAANLADPAAFGDLLGGEAPAHFLPGSHWKKLATSREQIARFKEFKLEKLEDEAALRLFRQHFKNAEALPDEALKKLFQTVGGHTLTIEILAKTLHAAKGRLSLAAVQTALERRRLDDPDLQRRIEIEHPGSDAGFFVHLLETFELGKVSEAERRVLQHFLLLPPEGLEKGKGHPFDFLAKAIAPGDEEARSLSDALDQLCELGWLEVDDDYCYSLHRLVRNVLLFKMKPEVEEVEGFVKHVTGFFDFDTSTNFPLLFPMLLFGDAVLEVFGESEHPAVAKLKNQLGVVYRNLGRYAEAASLLEAALASDLKNFGEAHPNVAVRQSNLALVYGNLGRYAEAASLLEAALASDLKNFGEAHPNVAVRQSNLANVYRNLGRYAEAASLLEAALASALKNFGEAHPTVAVSQSNLANVYGNLGRYAEAARLLEAALASDLKNFGEAHPTVAVSQSNLATVYGNLGRYAEAASLLEAALASDLKNFGEAHPNVAVRQSNLANVYGDLGRYAEAASLLEAALASALKNFGEAHPKVAVRQSNLATVYRNLGRYAEAARLLEAALASDLKNFGEAHPNVAAHLNNLAWVWRSQEQWERALPLFERAHEILKNALGEEHPYTKDAAEGIAYVRGRMGEEKA